MKIIYFLLKPELASTGLFELDNALVEFSSEFLLAVVKLCLLNKILKFIKPIFVSL